MATSFFNDIVDFSAVFTYHTDANKTVMNILIDTNPRVEGQATVHEEVVLMYRGTPIQLRAKLKDVFKHFLDDVDV